MWTCSRCGRIFAKENQPHSCRKVALEEHFKNKDKARELFDVLIERIDNKVGRSKIISIPCCIHLFGKYDFLAALPKKDKLEIRFVLNRVLSSPRCKQSVPVSSKNYKNCIDIGGVADIDGELTAWIKEAYNLKAATDHL